jgi:hypothetical protein
MKGRGIDLKTPADDLSIERFAKLLVAHTATFV